MTRVIRISFVLFAGLWMAGCAMPMGTELKMGRVSKPYNPPQKHVVYSNEVCQEFIAGVEDMALGLLTSDAITKAFKPPLIVIKALETEGDVSFDTKKYMETERNILMAPQHHDKVRFIDKETTEEANYYLYGVISIAGNPPPNDIRRKRATTRFNAKYLEQAAKNNQDTVGNKNYRFTMTLFDPRSNTTIWKDECSFTLEETTPYNKRSK